MYTRVFASLVGFVVARADLAVAKFVPRFCRGWPCEGMG